MLLLPLALAEEGNGGGWAAVGGAGIPAGGFGVPVDIGGGGLAFCELPMLLPKCQ